VTFEAILAIAGIVASTATALIATARNIASSFAYRAQRRLLQSLRVREIVEAADLESLGRLITADLGSTSLPNYVRHAEVRASFRGAFNAAREFIGEAGEPGDDRAEDGRDAYDIDGTGETLGAEPLTERGRRALRDVAAGQSWNALARMRRDLEIALRSRLDQAGTDRRRMAAGQMLAVAAKEGVVPSEAVEPLRYAISVANKAVHGEDVPAGAAVESIVLIDRFLKDLGD
jgi:hypothetical protein